MDYTDPCDQNSQSDILLSSISKFNKIDTLQQFYKLWAEFYSNELCIPTYHAKFIGPISDNPLLTVQIAERFKKIALQGFVMTDSQEASIERCQKQYITGLIHKKKARDLVDFMNRFSGIVAYHSFNEDDCTYGPIVTYEGICTNNEFLFEGNATTGLHCCDSSIDIVLKWSNHKFQKKFMKNMVGINLLDSVHGRGLLLDLLELFFNME